MKTMTGLLLLVVFTILCYKDYFGNVWYLQDDYLTIASGGAGSFWDSAMGVINWLDTIQARFQPFRLVLFSFFTHILPEELSFIYNFGLHLAVVILLFFLIRKFKVDDFTAFMMTLFFSIFSRFRMIESPAAMIAGSGLVTLLIILSIIFLIFAIESITKKKYIFFCLSYLSYLAIVFSYETAFPLFMLILFTFIIFNKIYKSKSILQDYRDYLILMPYAVSLLIFYFFLSRRDSAYVGATVVVSFLDIVIRFAYYTKAQLVGFFNFKALTQPVMLICSAVLYYFSIFIYLTKFEPVENPDSTKFDRKNVVYVFLFGIVWYLSSVSLFTISAWGSRLSSVMHHHIYLMSAGFSIAFTILLLNFHNIFPAKFKKNVKYIMLFVVLPVIVVTSINYHYNYAQESSKRILPIQTVKKNIQKNIDIDTVDAVIVKNLFKPHGLKYYQITDFNGALLQWVNFKKLINSGDTILSTRDNKIIFKGPLASYDHLNESKEITVDNKRAVFFYYSGTKMELLNYHDEIDFEKGKNIYQTEQVFSEKKIVDHNTTIEAILHHTKKTKFLRIKFKSLNNFSNIRDKIVLSLNGEAVTKAFFSENSIFIDVSGFNAFCNYYFLFLHFSNDFNVKDNIKLIDFTPKSKGAFFLINKNKDFDYNKTSFHLTSSGKGN
ncbi:MAG: hypothetical protein GY754_05840 [bacterium]|nr:hypothetical protein [bacterium]